MPTDTWTWIAATVVAVLGTARLTRLITEDEWPPAQWVRDKWVAKTNGSGWEMLFLCPFCMAPYIAVFTLLSGYLSDLHFLWWAFFGWLSVSYLAASYVARDGGGD